MKICPKCQSDHTKTGTYCSRKCANSRNWSEADKTKKSESAKRSRKVQYANANNKSTKGHWGKNKHIIGPYSYVWFGTCTACKRLFTAKRWGVKCCSNECRYQRTTFNNVKKVKINYMMSNGTSIKLDSSWELEVATYLDKNHINWARPKNILYWFDDSGKKRKYTPDFFLENYNLYLDVKNPLKIKQDKRKIEILQSSYPLIVLELVPMINFLEDLS